MWTIVQLRRHELTQKPFPVRNSRHFRCLFRFSSGVLSDKDRSVFTLEMEYFILKILSCLRSFLPFHFIPLFQSHNDSYNFWQTFDNPFPTFSSLNPFHSLAEKISLLCALLPQRNTNIRLKEVTKQLTISYILKFEFLLLFIFLDPSRECGQQWESQTSQPINAHRMGLPGREDSVRPVH